MKICALVTAASVLAMAGTATAGPDPKRKVAVLEYRSGSSALPHIDKRFAEILEKRTSLKVMDADAARATFPRLDADVVACEGDGDCVARLGAKLHVDEILLVGITQFGDVILTLQRIDVDQHKVQSRIAETLAQKSTPNDNDLIGYLTRVMPAEDFLRYGVIRIDANLAGAAVTVSGENRGETPVAPLKVKAPASYDLRITKDGFVPFHLSVDVPPDGEVTVKADLTREGEHVAWYGRWWVATLAGVVVLGAVGTGVWYGTRSPTEVPVGGHSM